MPEIVHEKPANTLQNNASPFAVNSNNAAARAALRCVLKAQRFAMNALDRQSQENKLIQQVAQLIQAQPTDGVIALFMPHAGEPNVLLGALSLLTQSKHVTIALPVVVGKHQALQFAKWRLGEPLETDAYGIAIPANKDWLLPDCIIAPCLGVSSYQGKAYRLGYGGGYYDRSVQQLRAQGHNVRLIGVAFEHARCQFPPEPYDVPLDGVLCSG